MSATRFTESALKAFTQSPLRARNRNATPLITKYFQVLETVQIQPQQTDFQGLNPPPNPAWAENAAQAVNQVTGMQYSDIPVPPFTPPGAPFTGWLAALVQPWPTWWDAQTPPSSTPGSLDLDTDAQQIKPWFGQGPAPADKWLLSPLPVYPPAQGGKNSNLQINGLGQVAYWFYDVGFHPLLSPTDPSKNGYYWSNAMRAFRERFQWNIPATGFVGAADMIVYHIVSDQQGNLTWRLGYQLPPKGQDTYGFYDGVTLTNFRVVQGQISVAANTWYAVPGLDDLSYPGNGVLQGYIGRLWFADFFETPAQWSARTGFAIQ